MKIFWTRRARKNLISLREYIAKDSMQNSTLVTERILKAVALLETQPHLGREGRVVVQFEDSRSFMRPEELPSFQTSQMCSAMFATVASSTISMQ